MRNIERQNQQGSTGVAPSSALRESNEILGKRSELLRRFRQEGYLFFRSVMSDRVQIAAHRVREKLSGLGWIRNGDAVLAGPSACSVGDAAFTVGLRAVLGLRSVHDLTRDPGLRSILDCLFGEPIVAQPRTTPRIVYPASSNPNSETAAHQDYHYVQGSLDTVTAWLPLMDIPREAGSLEVLEGSHLRGLCRTMGGSKYRCATASVDLRSNDWRGADFQLGDVLLFSCLTVHRALQNASRLLRLSVDCRFQPVNSTMADSSLSPAFFDGREAWSGLFKDGSPYELETCTTIVPCVPPEMAISAAVQPARVFPWLIP